MRKPSDQFVPLQSLAREWLYRLVNHYDIVRGCVEPAPGMQSTDCDREAAVLRPNDASAAPLTIRLTPFSGVLIRAGHWYQVRLPVGCRDRGYVLESDAAWLNFIMRAITSGWFSETIGPTAEGELWACARLGWGDLVTESRRRLTNADANRLLLNGPVTSMKWSRWPRKRDPMRIKWF
jgi:Family of unknown function (DUF6226)